MNASTMKRVIAAYRRVYDALVVDCGSRFDDGIGENGEDYGEEELLARNAAMGVALSLEDPPTLAELEDLQDAVGDLLDAET